jgi:hypothetical protein
MSTQQALNRICDMQQMAVLAGSSTQLPDPRTDSGVHTPERVVIQTLSTNLQPIFIKNNIDVAGDGSTGGYEMPPGCNLILPVSDYKDFYVISSSGTQSIQVTFIAG